MTTLELISQKAMAWPEVEEKPHFGRPAFRVRDTLFLSVHTDADPPFAIAHVDRAEAEAVVAEHPQIAEEVWRTHGGRQIFVGLRLDLAGAPADLIDRAIERAWRHRAPKRVVAAYDA